MINCPVMDVFRIDSITFGTYLYFFSYLFVSTISRFDYGLYLFCSMFNKYSWNMSGFNRRNIYQNFEDRFYILSKVIARRQLVAVKSIKALYTSGIYMFYYPHPQNFISIFISLDTKNDWTISWWKRKYTQESLVRKP